MDQENSWKLGIVIHTRSTCSMYHGRVWTPATVVSSRLALAQCQNSIKFISIKYFGTYGAHMLTIWVQDFMYSKLYRFLCGSIRFSKMSKVHFFLDEDCQISAAVLEKVGFYMIHEMNSVKFLNGGGVKRQACKVVRRLVGSLAFKCQTHHYNPL